jgi:hypothetical protein
MMHQYFTRDLGKQHIFVLHGLGGAGKTQTALKFIAESSRSVDHKQFDVSSERRNFLLDSRTSFSLMLALWTQLMQASRV